MCGYACIGCGACGKPKSKMFDVAAICPQCKSAIPRGSFICESCGYSTQPGTTMGYDSVQEQHFRLSSALPR